jgi:DNA-binding beta-propeller fold protein YncE
MAKSRNCAWTKLRFGCVSVVATLTIVSGCGPGGTTSTSPTASPRAIGDLLVGSCYSKSILRYGGSSGGQFVRAFISAGVGGLDCAEGTMVVGPDGNVYIEVFSPARIHGDVSLHNDHVIRVNPKTGQSTVFVRPSPELNGPHGMAFGPDGNLYVSTRFTSTVFRYDGKTGELLSTFIPAGTGGLLDASSILFAADGNLLVASYSRNEILRFDGKTGEFLGVFVTAGSGGLSHPHAMVFGPDGNLYVTSYPANTVLRFDGKTGRFMDTFVGPGNGLDFPGGLTFGPDHRLYVASCANNRVLRFDPVSGKLVSTFVASSGGGLKGATSIAFLPASD